jgi:uncharacterized integral membrane protein
MKWSPCSRSRSPLSPSHFCLSIKVALFVSTKSFWIVFHSRTCILITIAIFTITIVLDCITICLLLYQYDFPIIVHPILLAQFLFECLQRGMRFIYRNTIQRLLIPKKTHEEPAPYTTDLRQRRDMLFI